MVRVDSKVDTVRAVPVGGNVALVISEGHNQHKTIITNNQTRLLEMDRSSNLLCQSRCNINVIKCWYTKTDSDCPEKVHILPTSIHAQIHALV